jgi:hypothetical protein
MNLVIAVLCAFICDSDKAGIGDRMWQHVHVPFKCTAGCGGISFEESSPLTSAAAAEPTDSFDEVALVEAGDAAAERGVDATDGLLNFLDAFSHWALCTSASLFLHSSEQ